MGEYISGKEMPERDPKCFSVVFEGDLARFKGNPFHTETDFGAPFCVGFGNAFKEADGATAKLEALDNELNSLNPDGSFVYPEFVRDPLNAILALSSAPEGGS